MKHYQAAVIGGGSAGLAAAVRLKQLGIEDVIVLEKDAEAGGILNQCIHNGFGLQTFHEQLSGPAYAERFEDQAEDLNVEIRLNTMVVHLYPDRRIEYVNPQEGYVTISADAVILAVGCYERSRGAVEIPGERPSGIYTAGQAQRYLNMDGYLVGKKVFILGSGDIGLIMARRMTLEGAKVYGVAELMPYSNGLPRNMKQCLEDFGIPLYLSHTVTHIYGHDRLEDTLLLSVGLIPENHLGDEAGIVMDPRTRGPVVDENYMTSIPGVFACGNGLHVHDLVDFVTHQAAKAAEGAVRYLKQETSSENGIAAVPGENVGYVVPGILHPKKLPPAIEFYFRVRKPMNSGTITVRSGDQVIRQVHKEKLVPSEMEQLILAGKQLSGLRNNLTVEVKEEN